MKSRVAVSSLTVVLVWFVSPLRGGALEELGEAFWAWRAAAKPATEDDIDRIQRPDGWVPDWSRNSVAERLARLREFEEGYGRIETDGWTIPEQVDYRLLGSAIARVRWELEVEQGWRRNPMFYVQQSLGPIFEDLLQPPPFSDSRAERIVRLMEQVPVVLRSALPNLVDMSPAFASLTVAQLENIGQRVQNLSQDVNPHFPESLGTRHARASQLAAFALEAFRNALATRIRSERGSSNRPRTSSGSAVGKEAYEFYLKKVALIPYAPEELVAMARQEWHRAVAFEGLEASRNRGIPQLPLARAVEEQCNKANNDERRIREFLEERGILSVPGDMGRYLFQQIPPYLKWIESLGVTDDLTSPGRLGENSIRYVDPPSEKLPYFGLSAARDPRPLIVHEGVPGHFFQLALSWAQENRWRRHYYDSAANEGIAFYAEEMLLQIGLFDDSPRTREIIYSYMRLRALRVEVDVRLALGEITIEEAAEYLHRNVPMDLPTAQWEAAFFASTPGQAISYQIGKLQILKFLSDARREQGAQFDLRSFHDDLWRNGNVPIALQRWESLGLRDEIDALDR